jgi:preprotein translocase subunit SecF
MELFRIQKDIPFMRYALILNAISVITFLAAVFFLWQKGLHLSIEFTGGTVLEVQYEQSADLESIRSKVTELGYGEVFVQNFGSSKDVMIRLPLVKNADGTLISSTDQSATVLKKLQESHPEVKLQRVEYVGPQVGEELLYGGIKALIFVVVGIVIYLSIRFEWKFAVAGIIANLHDVVIILGFFAFFQWEFSLSVLAAVLAVLGYSVNESVVIFDRIREQQQVLPNLSVEDQVDRAVAGTLKRSFYTITSTILPIIALILFGGESLYWFAVALLVGVLIGGWSSIGLIPPLLPLLGGKLPNRVSANTAELQA